MTKEALANKYYAQINKAYDEALKTSKVYDELYAAIEADVVGTDTEWNEVYEDMLTKEKRDRIDEIRFQIDYLVNTVR